MNNAVRDIMGGEISARAIIEATYRVCWGPLQTRKDTMRHRPLGLRITDALSSRIHLQMHLQIPTMGIHPINPGEYQHENLWSPHGPPSDPITFEQTVSGTQTQAHEHDSERPCPARS